MLRLVRHLGYPAWWLRRTFSADALDRIGRAVTKSEALHGSEIRVAIEMRLELPALVRGQTARQRAEEVFSLLRVWDTEANNGVLIYMLLADRQFEIVADRGIARLVPQSEWERLCLEMAAHFQAGRYEQALVHGIEEIGGRIASLFPRAERDVNELPDRPAIL